MADSGFNLPQLTVSETDGNPRRYAIQEMEFANGVVTVSGNKAVIAAGAGGVTGSGASPQVAFWSSASVLTGDADFTFNGTQLILATSGTSGGILIGGDTQIYRRTTNIMALASGDALEVPANFSVGTTINANQAIVANITPGDVTANAVSGYLNLTGGNTGSAFPVALQGRYDINSAANTVSYAVGLNGQVRVQSGQSGTVNFAVGADCFVWMSSTSGATVTSFRGGVFDASITTGANGSITTARSGSFTSFHNTSATTAITTAQWGYFSGNIPAGGITTHYGVYVESATRTTGIVGAFYGIFINDLVAFTANNETRIGIRIDPMPSAGSFTGTTVYALDIAGTNGLRDGIRIGGDSVIYRRTTNILALDSGDSLEIPANLAVGTTISTNALINLVGAPTLSSSSYAIFGQLTATPAADTANRCFGMSFTAVGSTNFNYTDSTGGLTGLQMAIQHTGSGTITVAECAILSGSSTSTGTITTLNQLYVLGYDISSGSTITTFHGVRSDMPRASGGGTVTTADAFFAAPRTVSGGTITNQIFYNTHSSGLNAYTANGQTRIGIRMVQMPNPGAFTGTTTAAVWLGYDTTPTTARDGIWWGSGLDFGIFRTGSGTGQITGDLTVSAGATIAIYLQIPNGAGGTTVNAAGEICVDTTSDTLNFYDGTIEAVLNPVQSKSITIENPTATEDLSIFYTDDAITITKIVFVITGSTSVTTTIRHHTDRSNAGNEVVTGGTVANSTTTGNVVTSFNDATVPADSFIWLETTALSGTPTTLSATIFFRQDA